MKSLLKRSFALLMAMLLVFSLLPALQITADAATVDYVYADTDQYDDIIVNWGIRGEPATFLSPNAEDFYADTGYDELIVLDASALYVALYRLMSENHTNITKYDDTVDAYRLTDCQNNGQQSLTHSGFYSGKALSAQWDSGLTWNREHTWPQSKSANGKDKEDIMSIRPESSTVNSSRGNKAYGEGSSYYNPSSESGKYDVRGDAARVILYTYVRWGGDSSLGTTLQNNLFGTNGVFESQAVLLKWMQEDPVDTWEMGRNDSVESITGTRNVFVDYPELAFALFDQDIPDMDTPSGEADDFSYTVSASSNNTAYGTVSVNHEFVTAHPKAGYRVSGYEVVSGNPTVTRTGDVFEVTTGGNCSIRVLFEKTPEYTAKFLQDGKQVSSVTQKDGNCIVMPAYSGNVPSGYTFRGWVDTIVYNTPDTPAKIYPAGSEYIMEGNTTFYALLSWENMNDTSAGELTYKKVTSQSQISVGASVVIVAADYDKALSTTQNTNNRGTASVIKGEDSLIFESTAGVQIITVESGKIDGTYALKTNLGYLYAASSSSNWLRSKAQLDENGSFKITVNSNGSATIVAQGSNSKNNLQYNQQNDIFSCYSTNQKPVMLYVGVKGGTTYYTMAWTYVPSEPGDTTCTHGNTTTVSQPATCTEAGFTTVTCLDCGEIVSSTTEKAKGHNEAEREVVPTLTQMGYMQLYCDVCGEDMGKQEFVNSLTKVESWGLTLGSDVAVNFQINVSDTIRNTAQIHITVADRTTTYAVSELTKQDGSYILSVKVFAPQMTEEIAVQITNGEDKSELKTYSVQAYAKAILEGNYPEATKQLVAQMLHYGAAAQTYFGYHTEDLANAGLTAPQHSQPVTDHVLTATAPVEGIAYYGASLVFHERIAVRIYFTVSGNIADYTFAINGQPVSAVAKGDLYYVEYSNVNPHQLDQVLQVTVNGSYIINYCPMNYIVNFYQSGSDNMRALMQALYDYHLAAKEYVKTV